jgi:hypothetical protein
MLVLLFFMTFFGLLWTPYSFHHLSNQLHVIWRLNFICICFFSPCGHTWLLSLSSTSFFFHPVPMGEKHMIIYLVFEWFYITWKHEYTFVLCLLPTWASNMLWNHIIRKEVVFANLVGRKKLVVGVFFWISHNIEIPYNGGNIT